ncbi:MAG: SUMF1/EgtB/PvdO family nonheme iron enzyme [Lewinellaceae bacterium]|nr:SUMF1/EgtB/PvdO family nonheme iron enzyme [Lewinellaceae bacterium]
MDIILLTYANNAEQPLLHLREESEAISRLLVGRRLRRHFDLDIDAFTNPDNIAFRINEFRDRLVFFGFSGHAGRDVLFAEGETLHAGGIAALLGRCPNLKVVFLNGCSTAGQVKGLLGAGVRAVVAAHAPVGDELAMIFAKNLFRPLNKGHTLEDAYAFAKGAVLTEDNRKVFTETRGFELAIEDADWGLFWRPDAEEVLKWKLPGDPGTASIRENIRKEAAALQSAQEAWTAERALLEQQLSESVEEKQKEGLRRQLSETENRLAGFEPMLRHLSASAQAEPPPSSPARLSPGGNWLLRCLYRLLARFPPADSRFAYWKPLEGGRQSMQELRAVFRQYITPAAFQFRGAAKLAEAVAPQNPAGAGKRLGENLDALFSAGFLRLKGSYVLLLADTGMGKTTFLQKLFHRLARTFPASALAFVYAGEETLEQVRHIPEKERTILFLDALDEDPLARKHLSPYLAQLSCLLQDFQLAVVSSRVQFFKNRKDEWQRLPGKKELYIVELQGFKEGQARSYLARKFRREPQKKEEALTLFDRSPALFRRPLLLSWFDELLEGEKKQYHFLFEVYEALARGWAERESRIPERHNPQGGDYARRLLAFSEDLALHFFRRAQGTTGDESIESIARRHGIEEIDARSRSFLARNRRTDEYGFTHQSFLDFFLARLLLNGQLPDHEFPFEEYPRAARFYEEACWLYYAEEKEIPRDRAHRQLSLAEGEHLAEHYDSRLIALLPNRAVRAMLIRHREQLSGFDAEPFWFQLVAFLQPLCRGKRAEGHFVFSEYETFRKACGQETSDAAGFFCGQFLAEWVCEQAFARFRRPVPSGMDGLHLEAGEGAYESLLPPAYPQKDFGFALGHLLEHNPEYARRFRNFDYLVLHGFQIRDVSFLQFCPRLETLRLSSNRIERLPGFFSRFENLRFLNLADNRLTGFSGLAGLRELRGLNLQNNRIQGTTLLNPVLKLPELLEFSLAGNPLGGELEPLINTTEPTESLRRLRERLLHPPEMAAVQGGSFRMGNLDGWESPENWEYKSDWEKPVHEVRLRDFHIGKYPVTLSEYRKFIHATQYVTTAERVGWSLVLNGEKQDWEITEGVNWRHDAFGKKQPNGRHPVLYISWYDAVSYCNWLSREQGLEPYYGVDEAEENPGNLNDEERDSFKWTVKERPGSNGYRLPTEAEWEYAARGGQKSKGYAYAGSDDLDEVAWYWANSGYLRLSGGWNKESLIANDCQTHPVGQKKPNELGLHDMSGNVLEWCWDWFDEGYYQQFENQPVDNPAGPESGHYRHVRGGSWSINGEFCRVAYHLRYFPGIGSDSIGFRLARTVSLLFFLASRSFL